MFSVLDFLECLLMHQQTIYEKLHLPVYLFLLQVFYTMNICNLNTAWTPFIDFLFHLCNATFIGYLDKEQNNRPSNSRFAHLQAKHYSIEDKSYGDDGDRQSRRERYAGPITEFREKETFKPNVKLEYIDDEGHLLNSKEAFRYLSHKFHGKGPGKNKIEKRIKKSVQEQVSIKLAQNGGSVDHIFEALSGAIMSFAFI